MINGKKLNKQFKKLKTVTIRDFYSKLTENLKKNEPGKFFSTVKKIINRPSENFQIEELEGLSNTLAAEKIAEKFSEVSNSYKPVDFSKLPCYLPAPPPPQVTEYQIYEKLKK